MNSVAAQAETSASSASGAASPIEAEAYQTLIIRSPEDFIPLKTQWDNFLRTAQVENLCLTHTWLIQWLEQFPAEELLIIIVLDDKQNWLAVAPFKISLGKQGAACRILRHLQFIGTQPSVYDWMQIVIAPEQNETAILKAIAEIIRKSRWDVLDLHFMLERSQCETLALGVQPRHSASAIRSETLMPYLTLPATVKEYEAVRRKKTRLEVNRHSNRFEKDMGSRPHLQFQTNPEAAKSVLQDFVNNHQQYWRSRGQKSDFERFPKLLSFYQKMLENASKVDEHTTPKLMLSTFMLNDSTLSYQLGFWQGHSYLSHLTSFSQHFKNYSPGTLHMDALVYHSLQMGAREFNFGRGDETYKKLWTKDKQALWNLRLFRGPWARVLWALDSFLKKCLGKPT